MARHSIKTIAQGMPAPFFVWACVALSACAGRAPVVGVSGGGGREASSAGAATEDGGAARSTAIPADFRESMTKVNHARFVSNGHAAGRFDVDVYANAAGAEALVKERGEVPAGARFVEEHVERGGSMAGKVGAIMMMEKRERGFDPERGDWRYVVVGAAGELVKDGVIESCAGCHADAPHDHLFRVAP
jgi:hypothetical protein